MNPILDALRVLAPVSIGAHSLAILHPLFGTTKSLNTQRVTVSFLFTLHLVCCNGLYLHVCWNLKPYKQFKR